MPSTTSNILLFVLCLLWAAPRVIGEPPSSWHPTEREIHRGFLIKPEAPWVQPFGDDRSLRVLVLGGSNTVAARGFPVLFSEYLKDAQVASSSYCMNSGRPGASIGSFLGTTLGFEGMSKSSWPNLIIMEPAINSGNDWRVAKQLDAMYQSILMKYERAHLARPSFLIVELNSAGWVYELYKDLGNNITSKKEYLNSFDSTGKFASNFNRGGVGGVFTLAFSRFYHIPHIATPDALFPAFLRYFLSADFTTTARDKTPTWPYSFDGTHLSPVGHEFLFNKLIKPLLEKVLDKIDTGTLVRHAIPEPGPSDLGICMFARDASKDVEEVASWRAWNQPINTLQQLVTVSSPIDSWTFRDISKPTQAAKVCLGSTTPGAIVKFEVIVPSNNAAGTTTTATATTATSSSSGSSVGCANTGCTLHLELLHSWNRTFVGDTLCSVDGIGGIGGTDPINIKGNYYTATSDQSPKEVIHTIPIMTSFKTPLKEGQKYTVTCTASNDPQLSCITGLYLMNK